MGMSPRQRRLIIAAFATTFLALCMEELLPRSRFLPDMDENGNVLPILRSRHWYENVARNLPPLQFQREFRLHYVTFQRLLFDVGPIWARMKPRRGRPRHVDLVESLLMLLVYMADSSCLRAIARQFGKPITSTWRAIQTARDAVVLLLKSSVVFPTGAKLRACAEKFYDYSGLKGVICAVDGSHIPYKARLSAKKYSANRKGYISLVLHAFVDPFMKFIDVHIGAYGSQHDARILRHTDVVRRYFDSPPDEKPIPIGCAAVGDDAYPLAPWLIKKYAEEDTPAKIFFGKRICRARNVSERGFGVCKTRWPILNRGHLGYTTTCKFVGAAVVLHNYTTSDSEFYDFDDYVYDDGLDANASWKLADAVRSRDVDHELTSTACLNAGEAVRARMMAELEELRLQGLIRDD